MKAVTINSYGGPEVLHYQATEIPTIQADEILVQVIYAGVSPFDSAYCTNFSIK